MMLSSILLKAYFDKLIKADGLDNRLKVEIGNGEIQTTVEFHLDNYYHYRSALWLDEICDVNKDPYEYLSEMYKQAKRHLFLYLKEDMFAV